MKVALLFDPTDHAEVKHQILDQIWIENIGFQCDFCCYGIKKENHIIYEGEKPQIWVKQEIVKNTGHQYEQARVFKDKNMPWWHFGTHSTGFNKCNKIWHHVYHIPITKAITDEFPLVQIDEKD